MKIKDEGYIDLDREVIIRKDGTRLTEADAEQLAKESHERITKRVKAGRPSLSGRSVESPQLGLRITPSQRTKLQARAKREGKKVSDIVRDAIDNYV